MAKARKLNLKAADLTLDPRLQMRQDGENPEHVADMADHLKARKKIKEPVRVTAVWDKDKDTLVYYVTDGFQRVKAHTIAGRPLVACLVTEGTWKDAVVAASTANQSEYHQALKPTWADKRRAVKMYLSVNPRASTASVADVLKVSRPFVQGIKDRLAANGDIASDGRVEGRDGKLYPAEGTQAEGTGLRDVPLADTDFNVPDYIDAAIRSFEIKTPGELYDHITRGGSLDLKPAQIYEITKELQRMGVGPATAGQRKRAPAAGKPAEANGHANGQAIGREAALTLFEDNYGRTVRAHDNLAKAYEVRPGGLHEIIGKHLTQIGRELEKWKDSVRTTMKKGE